MRSANPKTRQVASSLCQPHEPVDVGPVYWLGDVEHPLRKLRILGDLAGHVALEHAFRGHDEVWAVFCRLSDEPLNLVSVELLVPTLGLDAYGRGPDLVVHGGGPSMGVGDVG